MKGEENEQRKRKTGTHPWKRIYGVDRKYTARVDRAIDRGQHTMKDDPK